jgi:hypothetical protein
MPLLISLSTEMHRKFGLVANAPASYLRGSGLESRPRDCILGHNLAVACSTHGEKFASS